MSIKIDTAAGNITKDLEFLRDKYLAIDTPYFVHKYLYAYKTNAIIFKNQENRITGHIYGFLELIYKLKKINCTPIFIFDSKNILKKETIEKRISEKVKKQESFYEILKKHLKQNTEHRLNNINLTEVKPKDLDLRDVEDVKVLKAASDAINVDFQIYEEIKYLLQILGACCYSLPGYEAEKLCTMLNLQNYVILSNDNDVLSFGHSYCYHIDFKNKILYFKDYDLLLASNGLDNLKDFQYVCIAAGNDYTKGLKKIGLKNGLKLIKTGELYNLCETKIENFDKIYNYLNTKTKVNVDLKINSRLKNKEQFITFMKKLLFKEKTILKYVSVLYE